MRVRHRAVDSVLLDIIWPGIVLFIWDLREKVPLDQFDFPELVSQKKGKAKKVKVTRLCTHLQLPSNAITPLSITSDKIRWEDEQIRENSEQVEFLMNVLNRQNKQIPFLLFGPFGTGKTKCLVELIKQVEQLLNLCNLFVQITKFYPESKILVCGQSNSACDKFVVNLSSMFTKGMCRDCHVVTHLSEKLFRLYSASRAANLGRTDIVMTYTTYNIEKGVFDVPPLDHLKKYQVKKNYVVL